MKLAIVIKECAFDKGGAERYASGLMWRLAESKHDVHLFSHSWDPQLEERVQCHFVPYRRKPNFLKAWSFAREVKRQLGRYHFDLVVGLTQFVPQNIYRTGGGIYRSYLKQRYPDQRTLRFKTWMPKAAIMLHLEKKIIRSPKTYFFIANSHMCREELMQNYDVDPKKIEVVYNSVDPKIFSAAHYRKNRKEIRHEHRISSSEVVFLFVGNGFRRKNLDAVLEMAQKLSAERKKFKCVVVGRGRIGAYRRKARQMGIENHFLFLGPQSHVEKWYHAADALIHPALYDPCSNACLEALSCGLPVMTTRTNGAAHWIDSGKNGFVIEDPRDARAFSLAAGIFFDPVMREKMRHEAPRSVASLTQENHDAALEAIFKKVALLKKKMERIPVEPILYV